MNSYPTSMQGASIGMGGGVPFKSLVEAGQARSLDERKTIARALDALQTEIDRLADLRNYTLDKLSPVLVSVPAGIAAANEKATQYPGSPICCQLQQMTEQLRVQINELTELIERVDIN